MARIFTSGWELSHSDGPRVVHEADSLTENTGTDILTSATPGRPGNWALKFDTTAQSGNGAWVQVNVPATDEFYLRMYLRRNASNSESRPLLEWRNAAGTGVVGGLRMVSTGLALASVGGGGALATAPGVFDVDIWYLVEIHWLTDASVGRAELKVDGTQVINFTGDTTGTVAGQLTQFRFGGLEDTGGLWPATFEAFYDDVAIEDASGTWIGDGHVIMLRPDANGSTTQMTGSDGNQIDNFALVDETPVSSADFVEDATGGLKDTYGLSSTAAAGLPVNATVNHVAVVAAAKTLAADNLKGVVRTGGTDFSSASSALTGTFSPYRFGFPVNPDTVGAWTLAELDAAEAGVETTV